MSWDPICIFKASLQIFPFLNRKTNRENEDFFLGTEAGTGDPNVYIELEMGHIKDW